MAYRHRRLSKVSENEIVFGSHGSAYRKGSALAVSVFARPEQVLPPGIMTEGTAADQVVQLYSFTALSAGNYGVSWGSPGVGIAAHRFSTERHAKVEEGSLKNQEFALLAAVQW